MADAAWLLTKFGLSGALLNTGDTSIIFCPSAQSRPHRTSMRVAKSRQIPRPPWPPPDCLQRYPGIPEKRPNRPSEALNPTAASRWSSPPTRAWPLGSGHEGPGRGRCGAPWRCGAPFRGGFGGVEEVPGKAALRSLSETLGRQNCWKLI